MTDDTVAFLSLIQKSDDGDFLKTVAEAALQRIMDYDVENLIGAAPHERSRDRLTYLQHALFDPGLGPEDRPAAGPQARRGGTGPQALDGDAGHGAPASRSASRPPPAETLAPMPV